MPQKMKDILAYFKQFDYKCGDIAGNVTWYTSHEVMQIINELFDAEPNSKTIEEVKRKLQC